MSTARDISAWISATVLKKGPLELATQAEVDAGTASDKSVTPSTLRAADSVVEKRVAHKTSNSAVVNSTTLVDDAHLTFTGLAAGEYAITCFVFFTAAVAADIKITILNAEGDWYSGPSSGAAAQRDSNKAAGIRLHAASGLAVSGGQFSGEATISASGEITVRFAQVSSDPTPTTLLTGSWLIIEKLA